MKNLTVGQIIYLKPYLPYNHTAADLLPLTVKSIGPEWITFENSQSRLGVGERWLEPSFTRVSPGRVYLTESEYDTERRLSLAWFAFQRDIAKVNVNPRPPGVTLESITTARLALGLPAIDVTRMPAPRLKSH